MNSKEYKMRKPKIHPVYKTNLVGIGFRERWNVVEFASKDELELYISNFQHIKKSKRESFDKSWWERRQEIINESTQNIYLRKLWRTRHSQSFEYDVLYRVEKNFQRWSTKLGPATGDGLATSYHFDRTRDIHLSKGDILVLTKTDEMGNLYFAKINEINAKHPYVFNRDNALLGWISPIKP